MTARSTATAHPHHNRIRAAGWGNSAKRTQHALCIGFLFVAAFGQHLGENFTRAFLVTHFHVSAGEVKFGADFIEFEVIATGIAQIKIEAVKGTTKVEVIYDTASGDILKQETEPAQRGDRGTGVEYSTEDSDFLGDDDESDEPTEVVLVDDPFLLTDPQFLPVEVLALDPKNGEAILPALDDQQKQTVQLILNGHNTFITGSAVRKPRYIDVDRICTDGHLLF